MVVEDEFIDRGMIIASHLVVGLRLGCVVSGEGLLSNISGDGSFGRCWGHGCGDVYERFCGNPVSSEGGVFRGVNNQSQQTEYYTSPSPACRSREWSMETLQSICSSCTLEIFVAFQKPRCMFEVVFLHRGSRVSATLSCQSGPLSFQTVCL